MTKSYLLHLIPLSESTPDLTLSLKAALCLNVKNVMRVTKNMISFSGHFLPEDAARQSEDAGKF